MQEEKPSSSGNTRSSRIITYSLEFYYFYSVLNLEDGKGVSPKKKNRLEGRMSQPACLLQRLRILYSRYNTVQEEGQCTPVAISAKNVSAAKNRSSSLR